MSDSEPIRRRERYPRAEVYVASVPGLQARVNEHSPPTAIAQRDLNRYYAILAAHTPRFPQSEASLLMDALNGTMLWHSEDTLSRPSPSYLYAEIYDAIRINRLDDKWQVDGDALLARIRDLSVAEALAIADAAERFWTHPERDTAEMLRELGLTSE